MTSPRGTNAAVLNAFRARLPLFCTDYARIYAQPEPQIKKPRQSEDQRGMSGRRTTARVGIVGDFGGSKKSVDRA